MGFNRHSFFTVDVSLKRKNGCQLKCMYLPNSNIVCCLKTKNNLMTRNFAHFPFFISYLIEQYNSILLVIRNSILCKHLVRGVFCWFEIHSLFSKNCSTIISSNNNNFGLCHDRLILVTIK